ncbi:hypothetical protein TNCV_2920061 [Trichonephila clavipes]|nr:hypothetical protein TNCV_2920061 [Trichonephila clavipes]
MLAARVRLLSYCRTQNHERDASTNQIPHLYINRRYIRRISRSGGEVRWCWAEQKSRDSLLQHVDVHYPVGKIDPGMPFKGRERL